MLFFFWIGFAIAVGIWASNKGRSGFGWFLLATLISPILAGAFLAASKNLNQIVVQPRAEETPRVKCPMCAELVSVEAIKCKHCGSELTPQKTVNADAKSIGIEGAPSSIKNILVGVLTIAFLMGVVNAISNMFGNPETSSTAPASQSEISATEVELCVARGIAYFKEIGSYPQLHSPPNKGRYADDVAKERCSRTVTAF